MNDIIWLLIHVKNINLKVVVLWEGFEAFWHTLIAYNQIRIVSFEIIFDLDSGFIRGQMFLDFLMKIPFELFELLIEIK